MSGTQQISKPEVITEGCQTDSEYIEVAKVRELSDRVESMEADLRSYLTVLVDLFQELT